MGSSADLAGCKDSKRSRTGYCWFLFNNCIAWRSTLQRCVSLSTCESEYQAITHSLQFGVWCRRLVSDMGVREVELSPIANMCDNQACTRIATSPQHQKHSRHVTTRVKWVKGVVRGGIASVLFTPGESNCSDLFTKPLAHAGIKKHRGACREGLRVGCYLERGSKPLKSIGDYLKVSTWCVLGECACQWEVDWRDVEIKRCKL